MIFFFFLSGDGEKVSFLGILTGERLHHRGVLSMITYNMIPKASAAHKKMWNGTQVGAGPSL